MTMTILVKEIEYIINDTNIINNIKLLLLTI